MQCLPLPSHLFSIYCRRSPLEEPTRLPGALLVLVLLCGGVALSLAPEPPPSEPDAGPVTVAEDDQAPDVEHQLEEPELVDVGPDTDALLIGRAIPPRPEKGPPVKGQKVPPCTPRLEAEVNGGCWLVLEAKAPCPADTYEHQGRCMLPVKARGRPDTTFDRDGGR
jgi:hypothetical protein